jgi:hypothetical protein
VIENISIFDSNDTLVKQYLNEQTDSQGLWTDDVALRLDTTMPGNGSYYRIEANVTGLDREISGENLTIYFKVLGLLNVTIDSPVQDESFTKPIGQNATVSINVTVRDHQGNNVSGADVTMQILRPDDTGEQVSLPQTGIYGNTSYVYNCTQVGDWIIVIYANKTASYDHARAIRKFNVKGEWPETAPFAFSSSLARVIIMIILVFLLLGWGRSVSLKMINRGK